MNPVRHKLAQLSLNSIYDAAKAAERDASGLDRFLVRFSDVEILRHDFQEAHIALEASKTKDFDLVEHEVKFNKFYESYYEIKAIHARICKDIKSESSNFENVSKNINSAYFQLPKIQLPTYNGNLLEWKNFISIFKSLVHESVGLSSVQKMHYLLGCVQGDALNLIKHLPISDVNYSVAFNLLLGRYENVRFIADAHLDMILSLPFLNSSTSNYTPSIRRFVNVLKENIQALEALELPVKQWSFILLHITLKKMSLDLRNSFELQNKQSEIPTFTQLLEFLEFNCKALEASSSISFRAAQSQQGGNINKKTKSSFLSKTNDSTCVYCKESHVIYACSKFRSLTPVERKNFVQQSTLCYNCLKGHFSSRCTSKIKCKVCNGRHHSLLHLERAPTSLVSQGSEILETGQEIQTSLHSNSIPLPSPCQTHSTVLLATAIVVIEDSSGHYQKARAILDSGSQCSFMSEACAQRLRLRRTHDSVTVTGLGTTKVQSTRGSVVCMIKPCFPSASLLSTSAFILKRITQELPAQHISANVKTKFKHLCLADPNFDRPGPVDLLLGADTFIDIVDGHKMQLAPDLPTAMSTIFGWVLIGRVPVPRCSEVSTFLCTTQLEETLRRFWEVEEPPGIKSVNPDDIRCEKHFIETHTRDKRGRFIVRLPFNECTEKLGDSHTSAIKRFYNLERRLERDSKLRTLYKEFLQEYENLGHMTLLPKLDKTELRYYIPHHGVYKDTSSTTKLRVVFDASMRSSSGVSLNHILLAGPKLQKNIVDIILRFRLHTVVFTADVRQMYRQILVHPDDIRYQTIFWRDSNVKELREYKLNTVTYGVKSAPFLAIRCLQQLANECCNQYPEASHILHNDIFVDDIVSGASTLEHALKLRQHLIDVLARGGFELRKWLSNDTNFLHDLTQDECEKPLTFQPEGDNIFKVLGLQWSPMNDVFIYHVKMSDPGISKRSILSNIARIFDPCGWLSPVTFMAKLFMQKLWLLGINWDDTLPIEFLDAWQSYAQQCNSLSKTKLTRHILPGESTSLELHGFSDASEKGYAAVVYLRTCNDNGLTALHLILAKSRVAPLKQKLTIPRLELCAALLLSKLISHVKHALNIKCRVFTWSDSTIVLSWVRTLPHRLQIYEGNRVSQIQELVSPSHWRHIPSELNPADCASRGLMPDDLINHPLWWAPPWLLRSPEHWPQNKINFNLCASSGLRPETTGLTTTIDETSVLFKYNSWSMLQRVTAWCLRFIHNSHNPQSKCKGPLTLEELQSSLYLWIKQVQASEFIEEIAALKTDKRCKLAFSRLRPFIDIHGILRVGGRLRHSELNYNAKHPIVIPKSHHFTNMLINYYHVKYLHAGPRSLLAMLRQQFWILSGRSAVRHQIHKCLKCFRTKIRPTEQLMGDLPADRAREARPFLKVGSDFAGPFLIKTSRLRTSKLQKAYLCVFVCFSTKAVHFEVVSDMSTDAFLAAFSRFTARRGLCSDIYTDCGTNFQGANKVLHEVKSFLSESHTRERFSQYFSENHIRWHFNPAAAPHFGGLWEAAVKSAKTHLKRVVGEQVLTFEELTTLLANIEAILNSRPLCPLSPDPEEIDALTPGHFLIGGPLVMLPTYDVDLTASTYLNRWQLLHQTTQHFWKRWRNEYLHTLQQRPKWLKVTPNLELGDLVIIKEDNVPPLRWRLGRIITLHPGKDQHVRVVTIKTSRGDIVRPVVKICPLPQC